MSNKKYFGITLISLGGIISILSSKNGLGIMIDLAIAIAAAILCIVGWVFLIRNSTKQQDS